MTTYSDESYLDNHNLEASYPVDSGKTYFKRKFVRSSPYATSRTVLAALPAYAAAGAQGYGTSGTQQR